MRKKNLLETPEVGFTNEFDYLLAIFRRRIIECETLIILIPLKVAEADSARCCCCCR